MKRCSKGKTLPSSSSDRSSQSSSSLKSNISISSDLTAKNLQILGIGSTFEESDHYRACFYEVNSKLQNLGEPLINLSQFEEMIQSKQMLKINIFII